MLLIYNNKILDDNESPINEIIDGDTIIIIEDRDYPDDSYYKLLQQKYKGINKLNIIFKGAFFPKSILVLSNDVTISEMLNAYNLKHGVNHRDFYFCYCRKIINPNDNTKIGYIYNDGTIITGYKRCDTLGGIIIIGKEIKAKTRINGEKIEKKIGTLNSTNILFDYDYFEKYYKDDKKIYIGKIIIKKEDNKSLFSLGIKKDFDFIIE